jgi:hypothetical protein
VSARTDGGATGSAAAIDEGSGCRSVVWTSGSSGRVERGRGRSVGCWRRCRPRARRRTLNLDDEHDLGPTSGGCSQANGQRRCPPTRTPSGSRSTSSSTTLARSSACVCSLRKRIGRLRAARLSLSLVQQLQEQLQHLVDRELTPYAPSPSLSQPRRRSPSPSSTGVSSRSPRSTSCPSFRPRQLRCSGRPSSSSPSTTSSTSHPRRRRATTPTKSTRVPSLTSSASDEPSRVPAPNGATKRPRWLSCSRARARRRLRTCSKAWGARLQLEEEQQGVKSRRVR